MRAAAYRHAVRMVSQAFTETTSFTRNAQAMVHAEVALPEDAPEWAENAFGHAAFADALRLVRADVQAQGSDMSEAAMQRVAMARVSEQLWNAVEHGEHRLNKFPTRARYARSLTVALPRELDQAAQIALMQGYVRASLSDRGMVADWVIHDKSDGNPHAHIMLTTRELGAADWGRKRRDWNARDVLSGLRSDWAQHANLALERAGFNERIDHRSNHARGIYLAPDSYNPHVADHARRQGATAREAHRCSDVADANALYLQQHPDAYSGGGAGAAGGVYQGRYQSRVPGPVGADGDRACGLGGRGNGIGRGGASGAEQPRWPGAIRHHGAGL